MSGDCASKVRGPSKTKEAAHDAQCPLLVPSCVECVQSYTALSPMQGGGDAKQPQADGLKTATPMTALREQISCYELPRRADSPAPEMASEDRQDSTQEAAPEAPGVALVSKPATPAPVPQSCSQRPPQVASQAAGTNSAHVMKATSLGTKYVVPHSSRPAPLQNAQQTGAPAVAMGGSVGAPKGVGALSQFASQSQAPPSTTTPQSQAGAAIAPFCVRRALPKGAGSSNAPFGRSVHAAKGCVAPDAPAPVLPAVTSYLPAAILQTVTQASSTAAAKVATQVDQQLSYVPAPQVEQQQQLSFLPPQKLSYLPGPHVEQQLSYLPWPHDQQQVLSFLPPPDATASEIVEATGPSLTVSAATGPSAGVTASSSAPVCAATAATQRQSLIVPAASAQAMVQMPSTVQLPPNSQVTTKEVRRSSLVSIRHWNVKAQQDVKKLLDIKVNSTESFPSSLPASQPPLASPVPSFRQVGQCQVPPAAVGPPRLSKSRSLDIPMCPRSLLRCQGGSGYNIPASLGVEPPQWLRSCSPKPSLRCVRAVPQRNSGTSSVTANVHVKQHCTATPGVTHPSASARGIAPGQFIEELCFATLPFDPISPALRAIIFAKLNAAKNATIVQLRQQGGLNEGMWVLSTDSHGLILKLVPHDRRHPIMLSEAEQFLKLLSDHPSLFDDTALALPLKVFSCREQTRDRIMYDLIVMRKAPGINFADFISHRWLLNQRAELMMDLCALGAFLAEVHARHNMQHGDFTPSNVFYDEVSGVFTMVDLADFGPQLWETIETDVERFSKSIDKLSTCYGDQLAVEGKQNFVRGYQQRKAMLA